MKDALLFVAALALAAVVIPASFLLGMHIAAFIDRRGWLP